MPLQPYLFLDGRCEEAIEFYKKAIGAKVGMMMRFNESPEPPHGMAPGTENKILHASVTIGGNTLLLSDGHAMGKPTFQGFALSLTVANEAEAQRLFAAVAEGGKVQMPLTRTFFSPSFGMCADKFGVTWMLYVHPA